MAADANERISKVENCIDACTDCHDTCLEAMKHCLTEGGDYVEMKHIQYLIDCAEMCQTTSNYMLRGSKLMARIADVCADVCEECAQSCEQYKDDAILRACARVCRKCADACRELVLPVTHRIA